MTSFRSLKRVLAAGLTLGALGLALFIVVRNGAEPSVAQGKKQPGDWIMYGGTPARNLVNLSAKGLLAEWDVDKKKGVKWVADLGSKAYGGPIIAGGRVYVGTNNMKPRDPKFAEIVAGKPIDLGIIMCFEEKTGKFLWQAVHEKLPGGQVVDWPYEGICSSPYVDGDRVYYVSNQCKIHCVDAATGKEHWNFDMIGKLDVFPHNLSDCSPLLIGDDLFVVTSNGVTEDHLNVQKPNAPSFLRLKVTQKGGEVTWSDNSPTKELLAKPSGKGIAQQDFFKQLVNKGKLIQHGQWSNPSYGVINGQAQAIFPGGDGWIYAYDAKAKSGDAPIWKFDCNPKDAKYELAGKGTRNDFIGTPVIYKNKIYIGVGQDPEHRTGVGHFWCIDMTKKGDISPELVTDDSVFPPKTKPNPNSGLVWHYGGVTTEADQKKLKRNYYFGRTMSTAAIHDDIVYITDLNGILHCLDANKGTKYWEHDIDADIWSSPYYADGKIFVGADNKVVVVFEHGKQKKVLAENDFDGRIRATPVAANDVLYVMTENKLYAIAAKGK